MNLFINGKDTYKFLYNHKYNRKNKIIDKLYLKLDKDLS